MISIAWDDIQDSGTVIDSSEWNAMVTYIKNISGSTATSLSEIEIDADKNWSGQSISNICAISAQSVSANTLATAGKIQHIGDSDTYIEFLAGLGNDIDFYVDGTRIINLDGGAFNLAPDGDIINFEALDSENNTYFSLYGSVGRVGIGIEDTPAYKLQVVGAISAQAISGGKAKIDNLILNGSSITSTYGNCINFESDGYCANMYASGEVAGIQVVNYDNSGNVVIEAESNKQSYLIELNTGDKYINIGKYIEGDNIESFLRFDSISSARLVQYHSGGIEMDQHCINIFHTSGVYISNLGCYDDNTDLIDYADPKYLLEVSGSLYAKSISAQSISGGTIKNHMTSSQMKTWSDSLYAPTGAAGDNSGQVTLSSGLTSDNDIYHDGVATQMYLKDITQGLLKSGASYWKGYTSGQLYYPSSSLKPWFDNLYAPTGAAGDNSGQVTLSSGLTSDTDIYHDGAATQAYLNDIPQAVIKSGTNWQKAYESGTKAVYSETYSSEGDLTGILDDNYAPSTAIHGLYYPSSSGKSIKTSYDNHSGQISKHYTSSNMKLWTDGLYAPTGLKLPGSGAVTFTSGLASDDTVYHIGVATDLYIASSIVWNKAFESGQIALYEETYGDEASLTAVLDDNYSPSSESHGLYAPSSSYNTHINDISKHYTSGNIKNWMDDLYSPTGGSSDSSGAVTLSSGLKVDSTNIWHDGPITNLYLNDVPESVIKSGSNWSSAYASTQIAYYSDTDVDHDSTTNFVAAEHISHDGGGYFSGSNISGGSINIGNIYGTPAASSQISGTQLLTRRYDSKPTAANHTGEIIRVSGGAGESTWIYLSAKNSSDNWVWMQLGVTS